MPIKHIKIDLPKVTNSRVRLGSFQYGQPAQNQPKISNSVLTEWLMYIDFVCNYFLFLMYFIHNRPSKEVHVR